MNVEPINTFEKIGDAAKRVVENVRPPMLDFFEVYEDRILPEPMSGCYIWTGSLTTAGYGNFTRYNQTFYAHRCAYEAANNIVPSEGDVVRHRCDFRCCCNPDHLEIGTPQDNCDDMWRRGRANPSFGADVNTAILTAEIVLEARRMASSGYPICDIARSLCQPRNAIDYAVRGVTWAHLPNAVPAPRKAGFRTLPRRGEQNNLAKLTQAQVDSIRSRLAAGEKGRSIAAEFGISPATVSAIKVRRIWA